MKKANLLTFFMMLVLILPTISLGATCTNGCTVTVNLTAGSGYTITDVKVNGTSKGAISSHKFTDVSHIDNCKAVFDISAASGYVIRDVKVNGVSKGAITSYTCDDIKSLSSIEIIEKKLYTVTYNANGGSGAPSSQTKVEDETLTLTSSKPTRSGYTFQGWATSSSSSTVAYGAGAAFTTNANTTLYAVWKANNYTVSYDANGGSGAPSAQTKTLNVDLTLSSTVPTLSGSRFNGWNTKADGTGTTYTSGGTYTINADVTLYAIWKTINIGDYIAYSPTVENYKISTSLTGTGDVSFTPASYTGGWRVFATGTNLEIISAASVGTLSFRYANAWCNSAGTLNNLCKQYINETYASSGRCFAYEGPDSEVVSQSVKSGSTARAWSKKEAAVKNNADYKVIVNNSVLRISGNIWLPIRYLAASGDYYYARIWVVNGVTLNSRGRIAAGKTTGSLGSSSKDTKHSAGVRPIITLKSEVYISGGSGTAEDPYRISCP